MSISQSPSDNHNGHKETANPSFPEDEAGLQACDPSGLDEATGIITTNNLSSLSACFSFEDSSDSQNQGSWEDSRNLGNDREGEKTLSLKKSRILRPEIKDSSCSQVQSSYEDNRIHDNDREGDGTLSLKESRILLPKFKYRKFSQRSHENYVHKFMSSSYEQRSYSSYILAELSTTDLNNDHRGQFF